MENIYLNIKGLLEKVNYNINITQYNLFYEH